MRLAIEHQSLDGFAKEFGFRCAPIDALRASHHTRAAAGLRSTGVVAMAELLRFISCATLLLGSSLAHADEFLVIGRVEQVTVLPEGHSRCEIPCPPNMVCISTSCGCAEASIRPQQTLLGEAPSLLVVSEHLDEWCRVPMPPNQNPILISGKPDGTLQWSYLNSSWSDGSPRFEAEKFNSIGGVPISQLPAMEGEVELGELKRRLGL